MDCARLCAGQERSLCARVSRCGHRNLRSGFPVAAALSGRQSAISVCQGFLRALFGPAARAGRTLILFPVRQSLAEYPGEQKQFPEYMADLRCGNSGEFATFASIAYDLVFPSDWGIDVGILAEISQITRPHRICQIEITRRYDHKHQEAGDDPSVGLVKMVSDITRTFLHASSPPRKSNFYHPRFSTHAQAHLPGQRPRLRAVPSFTPVKAACRSLRSAPELGLIEVFAGALDGAFGEYQNHPFGSPTIPDWRRIEVALDGILPELVNAFERHSASLCFSTASPTSSMTRSVLFCQAQSDSFCGVTSLVENCRVASPLERSILGVQIFAATSTPDGWRA